MCKSCYDKYLKDLNPAYKERQLSNATLWARKYPERIAEIQKRRREKILTDPVEKQRVYEQKRENRLKLKYGMTLKDYDKMFSKQKGKCAICTRESGDKPFHIDHCHKTKKVRGLLCHQCNWYLGTLEADSGVFGRLVSYMKTHNSVGLRKGIRL